MVVVVEGKSDVFMEDDRRLGSDTLNSALVSVADETADAFEMEGSLGLPEVLLSADEIDEDNGGGTFTV